MPKLYLAHIYAEDHDHYDVIASEGKTLDEVEADALAIFAKNECFSPADMIGIGFECEAHVISEIDGASYSYKYTLSRSKFN